MLRMGASTTYFMLVILRQIKRLGIYTINNSNSIEVVKDKLFSQQILAQNNLPVPKTMLTKFPVDVGLVERTLGFPVVVKTISGSQGSGVFLAETKLSFRDVMDLIESTNRNANMIMQEFIAPSKGMDLRVFLWGVEQSLVSEGVAKMVASKPTSPVGARSNHTKSLRKLNG